ncbi:MAG: porin family protein [Sulfurovum sp.]|nr:porin family protein [Sulfurovum sp.]
MKKIYMIIFLTLTTLTHAENDFNFIEDNQTTTTEEVAPFFKDLNVHFYLGAAFSSLSLDGSNNESFKAKGMTLQLGYRYNDYLSIEGRYTKHLGDLEYRHGTNGGANINDLSHADFSTKAIYIKPQYRVNKVKIYGMLGYGQVTLANLMDDGVDRAESGLQFGLGVSYGYRPYVDFYVDFEHIYGGKGFGSAGTEVDYSANTFNIGVAYKFVLKEMK